MHLGCPLRVRVARGDDGDAGADVGKGLVRTRHVLVVQHDRAFMRRFDLARAVRCMLADERVRYLLLPTRSTRSHAQTTAMTGSIVG